VPSLNRVAGRSCAVAAIAALALASPAGCKPKASGAQCDQLLDRYAELVVTERFADAGTEQIKAEREREKSEARGDDAFKNCSSEVSRTELDCAMRAPSADALEKCLE
jgi:hypothetical protein